MNVLLAVDQSRNSSAATKFVEAFRLPDSSKLYLLFVEEPQGEVPGQDHFPRKFGHFREELSKMRQKTMEKARQLVNRRVAPFRAKGLEVHPIVVEGIPGTEILTAIEQHQIDLVALGTKGLSGIKRFLLGSVSEWMLNEAPCSVLIVRGKTRPKKSTEGMKILIATDGSPDAQEGVEFLKNVGFPTSTVLTILHIVRKMVHQTAQLVTTDRTQLAEFMKLAEDLLEARGREGAKLLEATRKALNRPGLKIVENLAFGHEAEEILKATKRTRADLVVVGSKGLTGLRRFLLGSVAHKVARHASCSVLVVRQSGPEGKNHSKR